MTKAEMRHTAASRGTSSSRITPGERRELRAVVRQQVKVLRAEVKQRRDELIAQAEARLVEKYREEDDQADELSRRVNDLTVQANRQLRDLLLEFEHVLDGHWRHYSGFSPPRIQRASGHRDQLRKAMIAGIEAQVQSANLALDRQEADLLRALAVEGLETDAAHKFLARIPTVAELVPEKRLHEIEAAFDSGDTE